MTGLSAYANPRELVPGDPSEVEWLGREYLRYASGASDAARALRQIDTGAWVGPAGDAFRTAIGEVPEKLERGCGAFDRAGHALLHYAAVLREAQADARAAVHRYADGDSATASWQRQLAAHQAQRAAEVARAEREGRAVPPESGRPSSHDPGADDRAAAVQLLTSARERVAAAAARAAGHLDDARSGAPHEPGLLSKAAHALGSFVAGAGEATCGLVEFGFKLSPTYALIDPEGFVENLAGLEKGIVYGVQNPKELGKAVLDWDTWAEDPARALGHLVPDLLLTVATLGAGEVAVAGERVAVGAERLSVAGERAVVAAERGAEAAERAVVTAERAAEAGERAAVAAKRAGEVAERGLLTEERLAREFPEFADALPSKGAREFQTGDLYPHQDPWVDRVAEVDEVFWVGEPYPGQFVVPDSELEKVGTSARRYYEGVQVGPRDLGSGPAYRDGGLAGYRVEKPFPVAESIAQANAQFGEGGLRQLFVPRELTQLEEGGWIRRIGEHPLPDDIDALIPETGRVPIGTGRG
jgi:hypothetical protein